MKGSLPSLGSTQLEVAVDLDGLRGGLSKAKAMWAGFAGAAAALGVVSFAKASIQAFTEQEDALRALQVAVEQQGGAWDSMKAGVEQAMAGLQKVTKFADEELAGAMAAAMNTGASYNLVLKNMGLIADIAAAKNITLASAGELVGKAMQGNVRMLGMMFPAIKDVVAAGGDWAAIQTKLNELVGGQAVRLAETYTGKLAILTNQFGELKEKVGEASLRTLDLILNFRGLSKWLAEFNDLFAKNTSAKGSDEMKKLAERLVVLTRQRAAANLMNKDLIDIEIESTLDLFAAEKRLFEQRAKAGVSVGSSAGTGSVAGASEALSKPGALYTGRRSSLEFNELLLGQQGFGQSAGFDENARQKAIADLEALAARSRAITDAIRSNYETYLLNPLTVAFSTLASVIVQSGMSTTEKLQAVWSSFRDYFMRIIAQMAARWLALQALMAVGNFLGGGIGMGIAKFAASELGGARQQGFGGNSSGGAINVNIGNEKVSAFIRKNNIFDNRRGVGFAI